MSYLYVYVMSYMFASYIWSLFYFLNAAIVKVATFLFILGIQFFIIAKFCVLFIITDRLY